MSLSCLICAFARIKKRETHMDMRSLEIFIKTAELLHFGKASRTCNLSPSALTRTIQRLEDELGAPLFIRDNRSVMLTEAGRKLFTYARNTVHDWYFFRESIADQDTQISGSISVYASITAVYSLLPALLERYRSAYPVVQLALKTGAAENAIEQLMSGRIDLAVAALPDIRPPRIAFMPLAETPLLFIAPASPGFQTHAKLDLSETALVVPQSGVARNRLDTWLRQNHVSANISAEVSGNEALIAMVRLGAGVGIVPQLALEGSPFRSEISIIGSAPKLAPYVVGLCCGTRNLRRPAVKAMWELAEELQQSPAN